MIEARANKSIFLYEDKWYTQKDIHKALRQLGVKEGDTIFVHSQLKYLGKINTGIAREEFLDIFIDAFIEAVGRKGNVIMPTFSYSFCKREDYDVSKTPSTVGILTEAFRKKEGVKRSIDPIFSIAVHGPDKDFFTDVGTNCMGGRSIFDKLYQRDVKIIFLGERFDITFMHFVEQTVGISYRHMKEFSGKVIQGEKESSYTALYYVRNLDIDPQYALENIAKYLDDKGVMSKTSLGHTKLRMVSAADAFHSIKEGLEKDESFLLTKRLPQK